MIDSFKRTFARIFADLRALRNIESYVVAFAAIIFALLTSVGDALPDNLKMAALLAGVGLLVFNITVPEDKKGGKLDDYLNDRSNLAPFKERLKNAHKLWIYGGSAVNILSAENTNLIRNTILSHTDGELRVIIQNPDEKAALDILVHQLDQSVDYNIQDLAQDIQTTRDRLEKMRGWKTAGRVDYRLLAYSPGFSLVVVDPHKSSGSVIVEFYGYHHEHTASRMNIEITKAQSERWYLYWVSQFDYMWKDAQPPAARG